jgi:hypothetical protein
MEAPRFRNSAIWVKFCVESELNVEHAQVQAMTNREKLTYEHEPAFFSGLLNVIRGYARPFEELYGAI